MGWEIEMAAEARKSPTSPPRPKVTGGCKGHGVEGGREGEMGFFNPPPPCWKVELEIWLYHGILWVSSIRQDLMGLGKKGSQFAPVFPLPPTGHTWHKKRGPGEAIAVSRIIAGAIQEEDTWASYKLEGRSNRVEWFLREKINWLLSYSANCFGPPIPKFNFEMLLFSFAQGLSNNC